jgi:predicted aspartyl protease
MQALNGTDAEAHMTEVTPGNVLRNEVEVTTYFINDENMKNCPHIDIKIGHGTVKGVVDTGSEISLITEDLHANLVSQGLETLELKLQRTVPLTAFGGRNRSIKRQAYIPFYVGNDRFEHAFLVSDQLIESLLIGADFLQEYGFVANFKTNCLMYEIEGNIKECRFTSNTETELEPQKSIGHGPRETADDDVTQKPKEEQFWSVRKYVRFTERNRELYDEVLEREVNCVDIHVKTDGKENTPCFDDEFRRNRDDTIELNACNEQMMSNVQGGLQITLIKKKVGESRG